MRLGKVQLAVLRRVCGGDAPTAGTSGARWYAARTAADRLVAGGYIARRSYAHPDVINGGPQYVPTAAGRALCAKDPSS